MFIALILAIISYKKLTFPLRIMALYTLISSTMGGLISFMSMHGINNLFWINLFTFIEFLLITSFYYFSLTWKKNFRLFVFAFLNLIVFFIYLIYTIKLKNSYNNILNSTTSLSLVILSVIFLFSRFKINLQSEADKPQKIISIGVFMYFSSSFLILSLGSDASYLSELQTHWIYLIHSIFYLFFVISLSIAFILCIVK